VLRLLKVYSRLIRLPNCISSVSNIIAAYLIISDKIIASELLLLSSVSFLIYSGGIVLNDIFDFNFDKQYNPDRVLTTGLVSKRSSIYLVLTKFILALILAALVSIESLIVSIILITTVILYDFFSKKSVVISSILMGMCRAFNWGLGFSIAMEAAENFYFIPILIGIYISIVTYISKFEHLKPNLRKIVTMCLVLIIPIDGTIVLFNKGLIFTIPFLILFFIVKFLKKRIQMS
jgi:4-hydroxybenzoate polyprenyltransferase